MSRDHFDAEHSSVARVKEAITSFQALLEDRVNREKVGTASDTPYKYLVVRQALFWRTKELADGAIFAIESGNWLSAASLARLLMETVALHVELTRIAQRAGTAISAADLDQKVEAVLNTQKSGTHSLARMAALAMIDQVDKAISGFRKTYDELTAHVSPTSTGTLGLFAGQNTSGSTRADVTFGRYLRGSELIETQSLTALKLSLYASIHFLKLQMDAMDRFKTVCDDFARKTNGSDEPETLF